MRVLVIGSGGYMGRHLMSKLANQGIDAVGASSGDGTGINPDTGLFPENFIIPNGITTVVYLAQSPRYRQVPDQAAHVLAVNVMSVVHAAAAARASGIQRFIYISTGSVYSPAFHPLTEDSPVRRDNWYVLSKLHGEEALSLFRPEMEIIIVRPFGVYGPGQQGRLVPNLIDSVKNGKAVSLQPRPKKPNDWDGLKISLCFIEDAIRILLALIKGGGPSYLNLAGPTALSIRSMAETIGRLIKHAPGFEMASTPRDSNLIADIHRLQDTVDFQFTSFEDGLGSMLAASKVLPS